MSLYAINTAITYRQSNAPTGFNWLAGQRNWIALLNQPGKIRNNGVHWADGVNYHTADSRDIHGYDHIKNPIQDPFVIHMEEGHD